LELENGKNSIPRHNDGDIKGTLEFEVIDNPYYGIEQETAVTNTEDLNKTENVEVVTRTHNIYYEM
jgi:hypothetical protein